MAGSKYRVANQIMDIKMDIDEYFNEKYSQLILTTSKIIKKQNRTLDAVNVVSFTYLYIMSKQQDIVDFALKYNKTIEHTIYAFVLKFINSNVYWENSEINLENEKLTKHSVFIEDETIQNHINNKHNTIDHINNSFNEDKYIREFYSSLNKIDGIAFKVYYYDNITDPQEFADHFNIHRRSAFKTINKLRLLLQQYIIKNN